MNKKDIQRMKDLFLIYEKDNKYFNCCEQGEEITIEINKLTEKS